MALSRLSPEADHRGAGNQVDARPQRMTVTAGQGRRRWIRFESLSVRLTLAAATLALVIAVAALASRDAQRQSSLEAARRENEILRQRLLTSGQQAAEWQKRAAALEDQVRRNQTSPADAPSASATGRVLAAFVLAPGLTRGSRAPTRLVVPQAADSVRLQLVFEKDPGYRQYRAEIRTAAGEVVWSEDGLQRREPASAPVVIVTLPAPLLSAGDHELVLHGRLPPAGSLDEIASYYFVIIRR